MTIVSSGTTYRITGVKTGNSPALVALWRDGNEPIAKTFTDANGVWEFTIPQASLPAGEHQIRFYGAGFIPELPAAVNGYKGSWESFNIAGAASEGGVFCDTKTVEEGELDSSGEAIVTCTFPDQGGTNYEIITCYVSDTEGGQDVKMDAVPLRSTKTSTSFQARVFRKGTLCFSIAKT